MRNSYYLISSLPMLKRDERPFMGLESFMSACEPWLSSGEMSALAGLSLEPGVSAGAGGVTGEWSAWEASLRNRLARARGARLERDAEKFTRPDSGFHSEIDRGVQEAFSAPSPLEKERILDSLRWRILDHMESGHIFDFDFLCVYKLKLMLREKWGERTKALGSANFDKALEGVVSTDGQARPTEK